MDPDDTTDPAPLPTDAEPTDDPTDEDESLVDRARGTGVGLEDETIVGHDEPRIVSDPDPDAEPGAVT